MTTPHADLADEFRALARAALERMEPLLRGADGDSAASEPWQGCTWCPLCAAAALVKGERHPLITALAREGEHVLTALRALLHDHAAEAHAGHPTAHAGRDDPAGFAAAGDYPYRYAADHPFPGADPTTAQVHPDEAPAAHGASAHPDARLPGEQVPTGEPTDAGDHPYVGGNQHIGGNQHGAPESGDPGDGGHRAGDPERGDHDPAARPTRGRPTVGSGAGRSGGGYQPIEVTIDDGSAGI